MRIKYIFTYKDEKTETYYIDSCKETFTDSIESYYVGMIVDLRIRPKQNPIKLLANAYKFKKVDNSFSRLMNAKLSYVGLMDGYVVFLGEGSEVDIFSIAFVSKKFNLYHFLKSMSARFKIILILPH